MVLETSLFNLVFRQSTTLEIKFDKVNLLPFLNKLSTTQLQLFAFLLFMSDDSNKEIQVTFQEFTQKYHISDYTLDEFLEDFLFISNITVTNFYFTDENKRRIDTHSMFSNCSYNEEGIVTSQLNPYLIPYLPLLKDTFFPLDTDFYGKFTNKYSWILFIHLQRHFHTTKETSLTITREELFQLFHLGEGTSYDYNFSMFKSNILDVSVDEINQYSPMTLDYTEMKQPSSKRIAAFRFNFSYGEKSNNLSKKQQKEITSLLTKIMTTVSSIYKSDVEIRIKAYSILDNAFKLKDEIQTIQRKDFDKIIKELHEHLLFLENNIEK